MHSLDVDSAVDGGTLSRMIAIFVLCLAGLSFAGYMSGVRYFTNTCALGERCPTFFGYPACYVGFALYLLMTLITLGALRGALAEPGAVLAVRSIAVAGVAFAGFYTLGELPTLFRRGFRAFILVLPTCAWGLLVYLGIVAATFAA